MRVCFSYAHAHVHALRHILLCLALVVLGAPLVARGQNIARPSLGMQRAAYRTHLLISFRVASCALRTASLCSTATEIRRVESQRREKDSGLIVSHPAPSFLSSIVHACHRERGSRSMSWHNNR